MRRAAALVTAMVVAGAGVGLASADSATVTPAQTKKALALAAKKTSASMSAEQREAWHATLRERLGKEPEPVVNIFNTHTHETVAVEIDGKRSLAAARRAVSAARDRVNELANEHLRCHFTNEPTEMDARLFRVLVEAARHFGAERVEIVSGFRAAKYNLMLRKKGREVARNSQHTKGHAVDFRIRGVSTSRLRNFARSLKLGGVGFYPSSGFIHVDVGPVRAWRGK